VSADIEISFPLWSVILAQHELQSRGEAIGFGGMGMRDLSLSASGHDQWDTPHPWAPRVLPNPQLFTPRAAGLII